MNHSLEYRASGLRHMKYRQVIIRYTTSIRKWIIRITSSRYNSRIYLTTPARGGVRFAMRRAESFVGHSLNFSSL